MLPNGRWARVAVVVVWAAVLAGCGADEWGAVKNPVGLLSSQRWFGDRFVGVDLWEVVICRVPVDSVAQVFEPISDRLALGSDDIVAELGGVTDYFERWSRGRYRPEFRAGEDVAVGVADDDQDCVERALDGIADDVDGVLVVADAQHREDVPGGWGRPGRPCVDECPASSTGRAAYVGAADFFVPDSPPLDLVQHEIGHALDWPHSNLSDATFDRGVYDSPFDLMSDTAAGRAVDPNVRNAPGPSAVHLLSAGWLDADEVRVVGSNSTQVLVPADSSVGGIRLLVVPTVEAWLTVEVIAARGDNVHLGVDQVVVHRIDPGDDSGVSRRQIVVASGLVNDSTFVGFGATVSVSEVDGENWTVRVEIGR
jgi:hypothetical protein